MKNFASERRSSPRPRDARRRVLAEWRRVDLAPLEEAQRPTAKAASGVLAQTLKGLGLDQRRSAAEVFKAWNQLVDPAITAHAQPAGLAKGTLFVNVDSDVWKDEIVRYRRREILERLQHAFGRELVQRISFRVGG
jgi:predicted nucleic acid-binding Zn ribbon protein